MQLTQKDSQQITRFEHDESNSAKRVIVVGGALPDVTLRIPDIKVAVEGERVKEIQIPNIIKQAEPIYVPQVVIHKEIEKIEIPTVVKVTEYKDIPKWMQICMAVQILSVIILIIHRLI